MAAEVIYILRSAGAALIAQASLHGQLLRVEWEEEKQRLVKLFCASMLGFACLLCTLFFLGIAVLMCSWETAYRFHAIAALIIIYGIGTGIALRRTHQLLALGNRAFAATRIELAADIALLKSKL